MDDSVKNISYNNLAASTAATPNLSFTYETAYQRLDTMTDGNGLTDYSYHPVGSLGALMPKDVDGPLPGLSDKISFTYDQLGRSKSRNIGAVGNENLEIIRFDNLGRVTQVANPLGSFSYAYVGDTQRTDFIDLPNGQRTSFGYFAVTGDQRLQTIHHLSDRNNPASTLSKFDYSYSPTGSIATWQRKAGSAAASKLLLGYDAAQQLVSAKDVAADNASNVLKTHGFQYDKAGNRTSAQQAGNLFSASYGLVTIFRSVFSEVSLSVLGGLLGYRFSS